MRATRFVLASGKATSRCHGAILERLIGLLARALKLINLHRRALLGAAGRGVLSRSPLRAPEIAQSSISSQTACSSCSSQSLPGSAMAQLVHVPIGRAGVVLTLARTTMPGVSSTGELSGAVVIPQ